MAQHREVANLMGEFLWPGITNGSAVNISKAQSLAQRKLKEAGNTAFVPLMPPGVDEMIQKAIFGNSHASKSECDDILKANTEALNTMTTEYLESVVEKAQNTMTSSANIQARTDLGALMHTIADESVTYLYKRPYPAQALIPVEANKGLDATWDIMGPYEIGSAAFGTEDPSLTESDVPAHNRHARVKFAYVTGRLTRAAKMAGLSQVPARDLKAIRVDTAQDAMRALRERSILGVTREVTDTTFAFQSAGPLEYAGLYEQITNAASSPSKSYVMGTGGINTYGKIMESLDYSYRQMVKYGMRPNLAICDYNTFGVIRRGLVEYVRYTGEPVKTLVPGLDKIDLVFPGESGLPLVPHAFLNMGAGNVGSIFLIDTRLWSRRVLWQDTYEELANINTSDKFVISSSETLIDKSDIDGASSLHGGVFGITNTNPSY